MLWVGWFGFNGGSALAANGDAGMAILVTHISAATATIVWIIIEKVKFGKSSLVGAVTGCIAGLAKPAIQPVTAPTREDLPNLTFSMIIQTIVAVAADM